MIGIFADQADPITLHRLTEAHVDITGAKAVEVITNYDRKVVHVNVNGVCVLRICRIEHLESETIGSRKHGEH